MSFYPGALYGHIYVYVLLRSPQMLLYLSRAEGTEQVTSKKTMERGTWDVKSVLWLWTLLPFGGSFPPGTVGREGAVVVWKVGYGSASTCGFTRWLFLSGAGFPT